MLFRCAKLECRVFSGFLTPSWTHMVHVSRWKVTAFCGIPWFLPSLIKLFRISLVGFSSLYEIETIASGLRVAMSELQEEVATVGHYLFPSFVSGSGWWREARNERHAVERGYLASLLRLRANNIYKNYLLFLIFCLSVPFHGYSLSKVDYIVHTST